MLETVNLQMGSKATTALKLHLGSTGSPPPPPVGMTTAKIQTLGF